MSDIEEMIKTLRNPGPRVREFTEFFKTVADALERLSRPDVPDLEQIARMISPLSWSVFDQRTNGETRPEVIAKERGFLLNSLDSAGRVRAFLTGELSPPAKTHVGKLAAPAGDQFGGHR